MPYATPIIARCCAIVALAASCGCSRAPALVEVTGEVRFDGAPLAAGEIVLADAAGVAGSSAAQIGDGRYQLSTSPGEKLVRISAVTPTGKMVTGAMAATYAETVDLIPPRYNSQTELRRTVATSSGQKLDFELTR